MKKTKVMKTKFYFLFFFLVICLVSCTKSTDPDNFIRFKVNNQWVETTVWNASYGIITGNMLTCNVTSNMHENEKTININVNAIEAGEYNLQSNSLLMNAAYGVYNPVYSNYLNSYIFESGKFTITEIDTIQKIYAGTFYGDVVNDEGQVIEIREGSFRSKNLKRF